MVSDKFIRCCKCDAIHHVTPFDRAPVYSLAAGDIGETPCDDWRGFMAQHAGHRLEPLTATGESCFKNGSAWEPMGEGYIEVTNGRERLLLRRGRKNITEPREYEMMRGKLVDEGVTLEIQANEIRKELKPRFYWAPGNSLDDEKIELFLRLFSEVVDAIDPRTVKVSEHSHDDASISYGLLDGAALEALMSKCAACFSSEDLDSIHAFVTSHRDSCDVMTLRMRRNVAIVQPS